MLLTHSGDSMQRHFMTTSSARKVLVRLIVYCSHCNIINQTPQIWQIGYGSVVAVLSLIVHIAADMPISDVCCPDTAQGWEGRRGASNTRSCSGRGLFLDMAILPATAVIGLNREDVVLAKYKRGRPVQRQGALSLTGCITGPFKLPFLRLLSPVCAFGLYWQAMHA